MNTLARYVRIALSTVVLTFVTTDVVAQSVSGYVRNERKEPVPYATVVFSKDSLASSIISYAITDNNGRYEAMSKQNVTSFWATVSCLGYETYRKQFSHENRQIDFEITESPVSLEEIVVRGSMSGVTMNQDTVVYSPKAFTTGGEQSLVDIVNKMPGMNVDQSGNVSYQGKKIGKVLVDGKDVLSGVGGSALRTLSSDFASSIELISNYSDGGIENSFLSEGTMALNIKSDGTNNAVGTLEGGGGFKDKYEIKTSVLKTKEPFSVSSIVNVNNTNEPVFSALDYINAVGGLENVGAPSDGTTTITLSGPAERRMLVPSNNEYERNAGIANLNISYEPNSRYRMGVGIIYNRSVSKASSFRKEEYSMSDNAFSNMAENMKEQANDFASVAINQKWAVSSGFDLRAYTKVNYGDYRINNIAQNSYNGNKTDAEENDKMRSVDILQQLGLNFLVNQGLLYCNMDFRLNTGNQTYNLLTNADIPIMFQEGDEDYWARNRGKALSLGGNIGIVYPILKEKANFKGEIGVSYKNNENEFVVPIDEVNENMETGKMYAYAGVMKNKGLFRFDAGTSLTRHRVATSLHMSEKKKDEVWGIEPIFNVGIHFSKQHKMLLSSSYSMCPTDPYSLSRMPLLKGYNDIQQVSEYNSLLSKRWNTSFTYQYFDLFSRTTLFLYAMYEKNNDTYLTEYSSEGIIHYTTFKDGGQDHSFTSSFYLNKGINGTPLDLKATANYTYSTAGLIRESIQMESMLGVLNTSLGVSSRFRSFPINFDLKGTYNLVNNKIDALDISTSNKEYGCSLQLTYSNKAFSASLTGKTTKSTNSSYEYSLKDMDFLLSYQINKFKLKISGSNIFHLNGREWLTEKVTPNVVSYIKYVRHSGYLLLSLSYSL